MKKADIMVNNEFVINSVQDAFDVWNNNSHGVGERLRYCKAWVYHIGRYTYLVSYNTMIAIIDNKTDTLYDVLRYVYGYTSTSAHHIAKFRHDYGHDKWGCKHEYRYL